MINDLAIEGGPPVRTSMLPYGRQSLDADDIAAVTRVLSSDWLTTGPEVSQFELDFAAATNGGEAVAVSSGTAALHAAAHAAGLGPGDEAIVPTMTFAATANCVRYLGATVVFADVQRGTLNVDPEAVARLVTPRTKAIFGVDYSGLPADLDDLRTIAHRSGSLLIEDASHALGASYRGRRIGSVADITTFSFHPVKHITTGEGGLVTTGDAALATRMRQFRNHGITNDASERAAAGTHFYEMTELGYNYRLTDIQCALGRSQLRKLDDRVRRRRSIAARYSSALVDVPEVGLPCVLPDRESSWHLFVIQLVLERLTVQRDRIVDALRAENIGVNVHYVPVPWHPYYRSLGYVRGSWPVSESAYLRLVTLPMFASMTDGDTDDVVRAIKKVIARYRR